MNIKNINNKKFMVKVLEREMGKTGVDIHSKAQITFENGFVSNVSASFKEHLGNNTIIKGKNGEIQIKNIFLGIEEIKVISNSRSYSIIKKSDQNVYSIEIEKISQNILDGTNQPIFPEMKLEDTYINMKILEDWKDAK